MIQLERILDGSPLARNIDTLQRLVIDTGGESVGLRFGTGTVTWPGATPFSNVLTLAHGLGTTPVVAIATPVFVAGTSPHSVSVVAVDATNVQWRSYATDDASPAAATTKTFHWLVIG